MGHLIAAGTAHTEIYYISDALVLFSLCVVFYCCVVYIFHVFILSLGQSLLFFFF